MDAEQYSKDYKKHVLELLLEGLPKCKVGINMAQRREGLSGRVRHVIVAEVDGWLYVGRGENYLSAVASIEEVYYSDSITQNQNEDVVRIYIG